MKKVIGFTIILLFSNTLFAQKRCGTTDYLHLLENNHPEIRDEKINLEKENPERVNLDELVIKENN